MVKELAEFVGKSVGFMRHVELAAKFGLTDRNSLVNQILFLTGMNNFLGLQGMSKALVGELSRNSQLVEELRAEIAAAESVGGGSLPLDKLDELALLDRTLKEVMRLHPPVFFIYGRAKRDFVLSSKSGNFTIVRDEHLMGVIPLAHLDPEVFDDPESFNPDRFRDPRTTDHLIWAHGGHAAEVTPEAHICPGKDVALLYGKMLCRTLITRCEWELDEPPVWEERRFSLNVASPKGKMTVSSFQNRAEK
jgi:prostaglandin-endoperoxide synthase 2